MVLSHNHESPMQVRDMAIGVDIGGTNIKIGIVNDRGELLDQSSVPLFRREDRSADIGFICRKIEVLINKHDAFDRIAGIGVASPGILDTAQGIVKFAVNLGWTNLRLAQLMQEQLNMPVRLECDAVAGAIGERNFGAGVHLSDFLFVCLGTGAGASLYTGNRFYQGLTGPAIDIGHTSVIHDGKPCLCGNRGCLEKYVSATAIAERAQMDSYLVYEAAKQGDPFANQVFREAGHLLGIALTNCIHLFGVGNIIVGGGLSQAGSLLLDEARKTVLERYSQTDLVDVNIVNGAYPTTAGILGAASHWLPPRR